MSNDSYGELAVAGSVVRVRYSAATDQGSIRAVNEDSLLAAPPFWIVADGMGGHAHGDLASQAAIAAFAEAPLGAPALRRDLLDMVRAANEAVRRLPGDGVAGTTLAGVAIVDDEGSGPHWMTINIGDSRTYVWNGRQLEQQSIDHSVVQELLDSGELADEDAAFAHPQRNVITRALGAAVTVEADVWLVPLTARQTFLLCTDGLTKELSDDEIARIIVFHDQQADVDLAGPTLAERLVGAAIAAGGRDNISVVVVESELVGAPALDLDDTIDRDHSLFEDTVPRP